RFDPHQVLEALVLEHAVDGTQAIRPLGMPGRREVVQAGRMGDQQRGHCRYLPAQSAARKPAICRNRGPSQSHLLPVIATPAGGGGSSGTKNVGASGSRGSTRYCSKSVTPSVARKLSSIRKLPVKLRAGFRKMR